MDVFSARARKRLSLERNNGFCSSSFFNTNHFKMKNPHFYLFTFTCFCIEIIRFKSKNWILDIQHLCYFQVVRTFVVLKLTDKRVIRALKERERADGPLSR